MFLCFFSNKILTTEPIPTRIKKEASNDSKHHVTRCLANCFNSKLGIGFNTGHFLRYLI